MVEKMKQHLRKYEDTRNKIKFVCRKEVRVLVAMYLWEILLQRGVCKQQHPMRESEREHDRHIHRNSPFTTIVYSLQ